MNQGKQLFDEVIHMTGIEPNKMKFKYPNRALANFLEKNYGFVIPIDQVNKMNLPRNFNFLNNGNNKMLNSDDTYKNKFCLGIRLR